jgi:uncharacterized protein (DUF697 family)
MEKTTPMLTESYLALRALWRRKLVVTESEPVTPDHPAHAAAPPAERLLRADTITKQHVLMSVAAGLVPGPGIDLAASFAIQLALLARLSKLYDIPYSDNVGKGLIYSLFASLGGTTSGGILAMSAAKFVPFVGTAIGVIGVPVVMGAFTHAVGMVFTQHFESGGTFLDFEPRTYRQYFRDMFKRGKTIAREVRADAKPSDSAPVQAATAA